MEQEQIDKVICLLVLLGLSKYFANLRMWHLTAEANALRVLLTAVLFLEGKALQGILFINPTELEYII